MGFGSMALLNRYVLNHGQVGAFFERIREAQAPDKFSQQFLKDLGFTSSNFRAYIPLMKGLGFLAEDGSPKSSYMLLLDSTQWRYALARALKESYSDIFTLKAKPTKADKDAIQGKYKTTFNVNDLAAERAANTFLALLDLVGSEALEDSSSKPVVEQDPGPVATEPPKELAQPPASQLDLPINAKSKIDLCYNIQIHLPPTKDIEVYNAIFKSLKEHFVD